MCGVPQVGLCFSGLRNLSGGECTVNLWTVNLKPLDAGRNMVRLWSVPVAFEFVMKGERNRQGIEQAST